jgi:hypothetical protein
VTVRQNVQFRSGFPDDADYDLDVQPGRNIAGALKAALSRRGYRVSEPINGGDHGWELDIWRGRKRVWLQISVLAADECYLMTENMTFWLWPDVELFRAFLRDLQGVLAEDSRFRVTGWFSKGASVSGTELAEAPLTP